MDSGKWGYVDRTGRFIIPARFDFAFPFSDERAVVEINKVRGVVTPDGKWVTEPAYKWSIAYGSGFLPVMRGGRFSYLDRSGRAVFGRDFEDASLFANGLAAVRQAGKWGVIGLTGKFVVTPQYEAIWLSDSGLMVVKKNGLWGIVDAAGHLVIAPTFSAIEPFSSGSALVRDDPNGPFYFIRSDGTMVSQNRYWRAERFVLDRAPVQAEPGDEHAWIDRDGREVFRWRYRQRNSLEEQMRLSPRRV